MELIIGSGFLILVLVIALGFWQISRLQERRWFEFENKIATNNQAIDILTEWLHEMRSSIDRQTATVYQQFEATHQVINSRLDNATRIFNEVSRDLGQVQEIGRQIQKFQDVIQSPKLRGNLGEQILHDLLEQILPRDLFKLQYRFKKGTIVDAVISSDKGLIPIDSKFPVSAWRRLYRSENASERPKLVSEFAAQIKKYIDQVSEKYINPDEGTINFAIIYIPSEVIYYEIIQLGDQINNYANQKSVLFVSPNSFYYFLKIILVALEGKRLETSGRKILNLLNGLRQDSQRLAEQLRILTNHIANTRNAIDRVNQESQQLFSRLDQTQYLEP